MSPSLTRQPCTAGLVGVKTVSGNYTVTAEFDLVLVTAVATITLPNATSEDGRIVRVKAAGTGYAVTVDTDGGDIDGDSSQVLGGYEAITCVADGTDWWVI